MDVHKSIKYFTVFDWLVMIAESVKNVSNFQIIMYIVAASPIRQIIVCYAIRNKIEHTLVSSAKSSDAMMYQKYDHQHYLVCIAVDLPNVHLDLKRILQAHVRVKFNWAPQNHVTLNRVMVS